MQRRRTALRHSETSGSSVGGRATDRSVLSTSRPEKIFFAIHILIYGVIELAVGNMVKRVLHLIKEEHNIITEAREDTGEGDDEYEDNNRNFAADVKQSIEEMIDELENTSTNISGQAWEHIHSKWGDCESQ